MMQAAKKGSPDNTDFLLEIGCEELPAQNLNDLAFALAFNLEKGLHDAELDYDKSIIYATPRRLAVLIKNLAARQKDRIIEKRGPALQNAFEEDGSPTSAGLGFASSCGVAISELEKVKTSSGSWLLYRKQQSGIETERLLPEVVIKAINEIPIKKPMRWGNKEFSFIRPVHWLVMLYGENVVPAELFGITSSRKTYGHRFLHPDAIALASADSYAETLSKTGYVLAEFEERKETIRHKLGTITAKTGAVVIDEGLLDEVTGMVEWPVALLGHFNEEFLDMPFDVLRAVLKKQQRCFYIVDLKGKMVPYFVIISNITSKNPEMIIRGNERVMQARLTDAKFFYESDVKIPLEEHLEKLKGAVFHAKLGSVYDKTLRLVELASFIAEKIGADVPAAKRAALIAKADLATGMVYEFPELQGIMGAEYAKKQREQRPIVNAIHEHYLPLFSGDTLPKHEVAISLALADRIDTLIGIFGVNQLPTGDKDPFGLRRAALAVIRIILEKGLDLDLSELLERAQLAYKVALPNNKVTNQVLDFIFERLRNFYIERNIDTHIFNAVLMRHPTNLLDLQNRIKAVQKFLKMNFANDLIAANKRVNNILKKAGSLKELRFKSSLLEDPTEKTLFAEIEDSQKIIAPLYQEGFYSETLTIITELKPSIDNFFDNVMVIAENEVLRKNRLALLVMLRDLLCQVADISLLQ